MGGRIMLHATLLYTITKTTRIQNFCDYDEGYLAIEMINWIASIFRFKRTIMCSKQVDELWWDALCLMELSIMLLLWFGDLLWLLMAAESRERRQDWVFK